MNQQTLKTKLQNKLIEIQSMGKQELDTFKADVSIRDLDRKTKEFLYRAIDVREGELDKSSVMVESDVFALSELS